MNDAVLRGAYSRLLRSRATGDRRDCPSPEALVALVERSGSEATRMADAGHVAGCADCRRDLDLLRAVRATRPAIMRRATSIAAAAVILVIAGIPLVARFTGDRTSSEAVRAAGDVNLIAPRGNVPDVRPLTLRWAPVASAEQYEISIVGEDGSTPVRQTTRDTTLAVGADVPLERGREYFWTVTARLSDGGERRSDPAKFRLTPP